MEQRHEQLKISTLITMSRPRFWLYTAGPFLLGTAPFLLRLPTFSYNQIFACIFFFFFFTFPFNLIVYGINDFYDIETDLLNAKKQKYEAVFSKHNTRALFTLTALISFVGMCYAWMISVQAFSAVVVCLLCALFYSAPPIRAKAVPFLDTLISAGIYVVPAVVGCSIWGGTSVSALAILAGILWSIAMHAYSAIPDIEADTHAHIATVATFLGSRNTLYFCGVCFGLAAVLAYSLCGLVALFLGVVYLAIIVVALMKNSPKTIFKIYTIFPWINAAAGMILFFSALFQSTVR